MTALVLSCSRPTLWGLRVFVVNQAGPWAVDLIRSGVWLICFLLSIITILFPGLSRVGISHRGLRSPAMFFPLGGKHLLRMAWGTQQVPLQLVSGVELQLAHGKGLHWITFWISVHCSVSWNLGIKQEFNFFETLSLLPNLVETGQQMQNYGDSGNCWMDSQAWSCKPCFLKKQG